MVKDEMTIIFVTSEDLCPENLDLFSHWKKLKIQHPRLKITFFCPGRFHNKKDNDLIKSDKFFKWYKENKSWVEIGGHGVEHCLPPEFTKFNHQQVLIIKKMLAKLKKYLPINGYYGFKAPYEKLNETTIKLLEENGFSYVILETSIVFFKEIKHYEFGFKLIQSHTNISDVGNNLGFAHADNINLIRGKLHETLKKYEKFGITYMTISEYIEKYIMR